MDMFEDFSWLQCFWAGNLALVAPSLLVLLTNGGFSDKSAGRSSLTGDTSDLKFWQFSKKLHYYYAVGSLWTGWLGLNAFYAYYYGSPINSTLEELTNLVLTPKSVSSDAQSTIIACEMFIIHLLHRLYVSTRLSIFSRRQHLNPLDMLLNFSFYMGAGLSIIAESPEFTQVQDISFYNYDWVHWNHIVGLGLFIIGSIQHHKAHSTLAALRRNKTGHIVSTGYKLPKTGLFQYVSCPHYLSELLIYGSIGLTLGMKSTTWGLMSAYVLTNHVYMAYNTQLWYKKKFEDFPKNRKMLIPYLL